MSARAQSPCLHTDIMSLIVYWDLVIVIEPEPDPLLQATIRHSINKCYRITV